MRQGKTLSKSLLATGSPLRIASLFRPNALRNFASAEDDAHFVATKVSDGIVMFNLNRAKSRNALSVRLV